MLPLVARLRPVTHIPRRVRMVLPTDRWSWLTCRCSTQWTPPVHLEAAHPGVACIYFSCDPGPHIGFCWFSNLDRYHQQGKRCQSVEGSNCPTWYKGNRRRRVNLGLGGVRFYVGGRHSAHDWVRVILPSGSYDSRALIAFVLM